MRLRALHHDVTVSILGASHQDSRKTSLLPSMAPACMLFKKNGACVLSKRGRGRRGAGGAWVASPLQLGVTVQGRQCLCGGPSA